MKLTDQLITYLKRPKKTQLAGLKKLNLLTVRDLLYHLPSRYADPAAVFDGTLEQGSYITLTGIIEKINKRRTGGKKRVMITEATFLTDYKKVKAVWFHQPYIANQYKIHETVEVSGKVSGTKQPYITNPLIKKTEKTTEVFTDEENELIAHYPETMHISSLWIRTVIDRLLSKEAIKGVEDPLPEAARNRLNLPNLYDALVFIHKPRRKTDYEAAKKRFIFEEIFLLQIEQQRRKNERERANTYTLRTNQTQTDTFMRERFEFTPTKDQKQAVTDILKDLRENKPMARLLEGDVGSGKTAVAAAVIHGTMTAKTTEQTTDRPQIVYLTPTEVLAKQQFRTLTNLFSHLPIQTALVCGKECLKYPSKTNPTEATRMSKAQVKKQMASGELAVIVGTHALIQKDVTFRRLALIIIDEQHRFGVSQRHTLIRGTESHTPHLLSMTATPIPRTLALTIYGDLDISVIQEVPKERKPVKTELVTSKNTDTVYTRIQKEIDRGHQAYVLCPRIEESNESDLRSVKEEYRHLAEHIFPHLSVAMLHGKMKPKEKQEVMERFTAGETDVLVCTTVVEVGINVPNATVITILHAERFGLAQLHQLRGRVIRSRHQPYCYAVTDSKNEETLERLKTFESVHNGFNLAEKDMDTRGAGELAGLRQSGIPDLAMEGLKNPKLVSLAREEAETLIQEDPDMQQHETLRQTIENRSVHNE